MRKWEKNNRARQATDDNIVQCILGTKATDIQSEYEIIFAFPHQKQLVESASILHL
jgi:hypothetical protein